MVRAAYQINLIKKLIFDVSFKNQSLLTPVEMVRRIRLFIF